MAKYYLVMTLVLVVSVFGVLLANGKLKIKRPKRKVVAPVRHKSDRSKNSKTIDIRI